MKPINKLTNSVVMLVRHRIVKEFELEGAYVHLLCNKLSTMNLNVFICYNVSLYTKSVNKTRNLSLKLRAMS